MPINISSVGVKRMGPCSGRGEKQIAVINRREKRRSEQDLWIY